MAAANASPIARALADWQTIVALSAELADAWARFDASAAAYAAAVVAADRDNGAELRSPFVTDRPKVFLAARAFAILNTVTDASPDAKSAATTFANTFADAVSDAFAHAK